MRIREIYAREPVNVDVDETGRNVHAVGLFGSDHIRGADHPFADLQPRQSKAGNIGFEPHEIIIRQSETRALDCFVICVIMVLATALLLRL